MSDYQIIVIGAGPGGYEAALHAAKHGAKVACIEKRDAGGTCLNRGCIPTKALLHAAEISREAKEGAAYGVHAGDVTTDIAEMYAYKNGVTEKLRTGVESLFKSAKVDYFKGIGQITRVGDGPEGAYGHEVTVTAADGSTQTITGDNIMIATGSVPAMPPIPGLNLPGVMTSDELLDGEPKVYKSLIIIGGGVIGVEIASFFAELGTEVTIVEGLDRLLPLLDKELGQNLAMMFKKQGVKINTGAMVKMVEADPSAAGENGSGYKVTFTKKDAEESVSAEAVLCAIGRSPFAQGIVAEGIDLEMNRRAVAVGENFATNIPGIYAIGDVSSRIQLAHVATAQGIVCVDHILGRENSMDLSVVPSCIYVRPEIASVGMTEAEAKDAGIEVKVGKAVMGANARTLIMGTGRSFMKVVTRKDNGQILGAQFMCEHSTDMISQASLAIANKMTAKDMLRYMRPHPTFEEALTAAVENAAE